jgi:phosphoglycolate phosphatase
MQGLDVLPKIVVFDWDGTLVDSTMNAFEALNDVLKHYNLPEKSAKEFCTFAAQQSVRQAFPSVFGEKASEARRLFYHSLSCKKAKALPGAEHTLRLLKSLGVHLAIVSNKDAEPLREEVASFGWVPFFHRIVGAGDAEDDKPSVLPLMAAIPDDHELIPKEEKWFVGDSPVDMVCAWRGGFLPISVWEEMQELPFPLLYVSGCEGLLSRLRFLMKEEDN